jgi:hypothetical protein
MPSAAEADRYSHTGTDKLNPADLVDDLKSRKATGSASCLSSGGLGVVTPAPRCWKKIGARSKT